MNWKKFFEDIYFDALLFAIALSYLLFNWKSNLAHIWGVSLFLISIIFWVIARINLGKSFSVKAQAKNLVTNGIYSKIRHPMYIFSTLAVLGIVIAIEKFYLYPIIILLIIIQAFRIRREEKILREKFVRDYLEYKKNTWF